MSKINISIFASAVRPQLWPDFLKYVKHNSNIEVIFSGNAKGYEEFLSPRFKYIHTSNLKPAQNYAIASCACTGETISWGCDDAEYSNLILETAYDYWKSQDNEKLILSLQTKESGYNLPISQLFDMKQHCFFGNCPDTPLMAPMCLMSRKFFNDLGGIDRRYIAGQYENDIVMRAYSQGAKVEIFGDKECYINIDHMGKSLSIGESKVESDFLNRPFASGYQKDRRTLEESWCRFNVHKLEKLIASGKKQVHQSEVYDISATQLDAFQPYPEEISLVKSEEPCGIWQ